MKIVGEELVEPIEIIKDKKGNVKGYKQNRPIELSEGNLIEIQKRIVITQKEIDKIIKGYKKMPKKFHLCMGDFSGNRDDIIREIKKSSEIGKQILLMRYKFNEWLKEQKKD